MPQQTSYLIVAAIIRRGDEVLLVVQQGPDDPAPAWALPGGVVEASESLVAALTREVRVESGLIVEQIGPLAYVTQLHNPTAHMWSPGELPQPGGMSTVFVFEVAAWQGGVRIDDPDNLISEAYFMSLAEAVDKLTTHPAPIMRDPIVAYLHGAVGRGTVWSYQPPARRQRYPHQPPLIHLSKIGGV